MEDENEDESEERKEEGKRVQRGRRHKKGKNKCTCSTYVLDGRRMGRD